MKPVVSRPCELGAFDKRRVLSRVQMMLVTFIAMTCVSCSLFPKKDLNGTEDEKPKAAQTILTSLASVNATLDVLYSSVSRGLEESVLTSLELFVVEAAAKKTESKDKADLIKTGLEILVDLKASKIDPSAFKEAVRALRQTIILFDVSALRYIQDVGRQALPQGLALSPELLAINSSLARGLFTLAAVSERAGLQPADGVLPAVPEETTQRVKEIESKLIKIKTDTFLILQPHLVDALSVPAGGNMGGSVDRKQIDFALAILENGVLLTSALQTQKDTGQIDKNGLSGALKAWSGEVKTIAGSGAAGEIPSLPTIPETAPILDLSNGALPAGTKDWVFALLEKPTSGSVDLTQNPPIYLPTATETFSIDRYSFRACFRMVPTFCTIPFAVIVQTPLKPWTVTIKTAEGVANTFARGDELVCAAALESSKQIPVFRWTLVGVRPTDGNLAVLQSRSIDVTGWQVAPGRLKTPNTKTGTGGADNDIREGDKIRCEVKARAANGLESAFTAPTLAVMTATNSAPSNMQLPTNFLGFEEQVAGDSLPASTFVNIEISDMDGAWTENTDTLSAGHISNLTIEDCDGASPCPFEKEIPQTQTLSRFGTYYVKLKQVAPLNFETKSFYDLKIKAVDAGSQQIIRVLRIPVINRNDPVTSISPNTLEELENKVLSQTLTSIDDDCASESVCQSGYTYALTGADSAYFEIVGRTLRSKAPLNFEQLESSVRRSPIYTFTVIPTDVAGVIQSGRTFTVEVKNVNEDPSDIALTNLTLFENTTAGTELGTLTTTDPDAVVGDSADAIQGNFTYTLTMLNTATIHFEIAGNKVRTTSNPINFEATPTLEFMVTSRDLGGQTKTKTFSVTILDRNEAPTSISFSQTTLLHTRSIQGQDPDELNPTIDINSYMDLFAVDPDGTPQTFTFEITKINDVEYDETNNVSHPFEIIPGSSVLQPKRVLSYSSVTDRSTKVKVRVKDQEDLLSPEIELTVNLREITLTSSPIKENLGAMTVGQFCVGIGLSTDCSANWSYSLINPPVGDYFAVSGRDLQTTKVINFETFPGLTANTPSLGSPRSGYFYMQVRATNSAVADFTQQIKIEIEDQNERPTPIDIIRPNSLGAIDAADQSLYILDGQQATGELVKVLTLETSDTDAGDQMTWTIIASNTYSPDRSYFELHKISDFQAEVRLCAVITANCLALPTGREQFKIRVSVSDQDGLNQIRDLTFTVVPYPKVSLWPGSATPFHRGLHEISDEALKIDLRIDDASNQTPCALVGSAENKEGLIVKAITHTGEAVLESSGISITQVQSGAGFKRCSISLVPLENGAGTVSLTMMARAKTNIGTGLLDSRIADDLLFDATFWRKPEVRCAQRVSLPVGASLSDMECKIHYSDASAPATRSDSISISGCADANLAWAAGKVSAGVMPNSACTATVSVSGVVNKFNIPLSIESQTMRLFPRKFGTNGAVFASAEDAQGHVYLGGAFTAVNPIPAPGSTALSVSSGTRASECNLTEGFNGKVNAVVYDASDDSFLIGGDFTSYRNQEFKRLIRLSCSGKPAAWFTNRGFDNGSVHAIVIASDGTILVGGTFTKYGTETSRALVRLKANGVRKTLYTGFSQSTSADGVYALALAATPETLWVGGRFSSYPASVEFPSVNSPHLVRIDLSTGVNQLQVSHGVALPVYALASFAAGVFAGGEFIGPKKFAETGAPEGSFTPGSSDFADTTIKSLLFDGTSALYVGATGMIASVDSTHGALNTNFGTSGKLVLLDSNPNVTPTAEAMSLLGAHIFVGGRFSTIRGLPRSNVAKFSIDPTSLGTVDTTFNPGHGTNDAVKALAIFNANSSLFLGGEFSTVAGTSAGRLAAFEANGNFDSDLNQSLGTGFNGDVLALQFADNDLFVGGAFTELNGIAQARLVKLLNPEAANGGPGIVDSSFDILAGFNGDVRALALSTDAAQKLLVGGSFTQYRGAPVPSLIRLETSGTPAARDTTFNVSFVGNAGRGVSINTLALSEASGSNYSVYVGGDFSKCNNNFSANLVKVNQNGQRDTNFTVGSDGFNGPLNALVLSGSTLYAGGSFSSYKGTASENIISLNTTSAAVLASAKLKGGDVYALRADPAGGLWAGGAFNVHENTQSTSIGPFVRLTASLGLAVNAGVGTVMGAHHPSEFNSAGLGYQFNSSVFGVHTILQTQEGSGLEAISRFHLGGFFSLLSGFSANHSVRIDANGTEAPPP